MSKAKQALALTAAIAAIHAAPLHAQIVVPSTYTTAITVQTEPVGAEFDDWAASGIPVVDNDAADNPGFVDLGNFQIANDANYLYMHMTMHSEPMSLGNMYLAFDVDADKTTGFDVFQVGLIGAEFAYQTDFPFQQAAGVFNTGATVTGEIALIFPFWTDAGAPFGNEAEWRIPLTSTIAGEAVFPNQTFDVMVYNTDGLGDVSQVIRYTLAEAPEPGGDFNGDGAVDGHDFLAWQRAEGTTLDGPALEAWKTAYGTSTIAAAAVPEPTSIALALSVGVLLLATSRKAVR